MIRLYPLRPPALNRQGNPRPTVQLAPIHTHSVTSITKKPQLLIDRGEQGKRAPHFGYPMRLLDAQHPGEVLAPGSPFPPRRVQTMKFFGRVRHPFMLSTAKDREPSTPGKRP